MLYLMSEISPVTKDKILDHEIPGFCFMRELEETAKITKNNISYITDGLEESHFRKVAEDIRKIYIKHCHVEDATCGKDSTVTLFSDYLLFVFYDWK